MIEIKYQGLSHNGKMRIPATNTADRVAVVL